MTSPRHSCPKLLAVRGKTVNYGTGPILAFVLVLSLYNYNQSCTANLTLFFDRNEKFWIKTTT